MMKNRLLILCFAASSYVIGQENSTNVVFEKLIQAIENSNSTLSDSASYTVESKDEVIYAVKLVSKEKNSVEETAMHVELNFSMFDDTYAIPSAQGTTVIVSFKKEVLITKTKTEFENLFHEEIVTEDLNEAAEIWFNFKNEADANDFEKQLSQFKKLLNSN